MPINPNALSSPQPEPPAVADDGQPLEQERQPDEHLTHDAQGQPKRTRRNKAQMIADAVIPAADALVDVKDSGTGAKVQRPWAEAVALVKAEKAEFVDKSLRYAVLKQEQQQAAPAFEEQQSQDNVFASAARQAVTDEGEMRYVEGQASDMVKRDTFIDAHGVEYVRISDISGGHEATMTLEDWKQLPFSSTSVSEKPGDREVRYTIDGQALLKLGEGGGNVSWTSERGGGVMTADEWELLSMSPAPAGVASSNVPPGAEIGDEVRVGAETLRVGHGGVLTNAPVAVNGEVVKPKRRWQRELGGGVNGAWESTVVGDTTPDQPQPSAFAGQSAPAATNGNGASTHDPGDIKVETERLPREMEQIDLNTWKISTGTLEKIGLPDYSSFQIGPVSITRHVLDDGRRTKVFLGDREAEVPTSIIEGFETMDNTVEFINRRFRGQLRTFLESTGAIKQPVS